MGNEGLKSSSKHRSHTIQSNQQQQQYISKDDDEIELSKPQRRMDKIRRSLSFRKKKSKHKEQLQQQPLQQASSSAGDGASTTSNNKSNSNSVTNNVTSTNNNSNQLEKYTIDTTKPTSWQDDERKVRDGTCSFHVKYLGSIEVFESRGMNICEQAIERLISQKKKQIKAILYVSGDSLRVVDETNKTLLVDQTIEKVSFCAPDRFHDNGFAYICRDGTTRRWLCHGFLAIKDTIRNTTSNSSGGERLSHAVGCAFSVCLERKQKRERENVTMEVGPNHSFTRLGSFRQASLTERLEDPQIVIPAAEPAPIKKVDNPYAIERPKGNSEILSRQNSLRSYQGPFKRNTSAYTSLKPNELPSFQAQKLNSIFNKTTTTTTNNTSTTNTLTTTTTTITATTAANDLNSPNKTDNKINTINESPEENLTNDSYNNNHQTNSISQTPPPLPPLPAQLSYRSTTSPNQQQPPPLPPLPAQLQQQQQQQQSFVNINTTNHIKSEVPQFPSQPLSPPPSATYWNTQQAMFNTPIINGTYATTSSIFATPQSPITQQQQQQTYPIVYNYPNQMMFTPTQQQQLYYNQQYQQIQPQYQLNSIQTPTAPANETFEAKWARLQQLKRTTNPFAEDILKKYEIKL